MQRAATAADGSAAPRAKAAKRTRKREFLGEMERVVPWKVLVEIIERLAPKSKTGRPPFAIETMLRIHYMQQWFGLSDPAMEEALHDVPLYLEFAGLSSGGSRIPDETTILRFRHLLERHDLAVDMLRVVNDLLQRKGLMLRAGTAVDATLIAAPSSTKNASGERDPEMKQTKKGNQWHFGMKAHVGVDAQSGLVHSLRGTAANVNDVVPANSLLHGKERVVFADAGYQGANKRPDAKPDVTWHVARRPSSRRPFEKEGKLGQIIDKIEHLKASVRAKVEHVFRVVKRQFGHTKVRYRGLAKNTAQLHTLFALTNLWMARKKLLILDGQVRPQRARTA
ncbi:MAG: IS5 family transposase [Rubrivivax sp.]